MDVMAAQDDVVRLGIDGVVASQLYRNAVSVPSSCPSRSKIIAHILLCASAVFALPQ